MTINIQSPCDVTKGSDASWPVQGQTGLASVLFLPLSRWPPFYLHPNRRHRKCGGASALAGSAKPSTLAGGCKQRANCAVSWESVDIWFGVGKTEVVKEQLGRRQGVQRFTSHLRSFSLAALQR